MSDRRAKVPLSSAEVTRVRDEVETLIQVAHLDAEPPSTFGLRECGDRRAIGDFARGTTDPAYDVWPDLHARLEYSLSSQFVDVELQPILEASSLSRSWHLYPR